MKTIFGMMKSLLVGEDKLERKAERSIESFDEISDEFQRGRMAGRAEAYRAVESTIRDRLDPRAYYELVSEEISDREDPDEPLRITILRKWTRAKTEAERNDVLFEISAARHEIRIEHLPSEPELRGAISKLESELHSIERGYYSIAPCDISRSQNEDAEYSSQREAPLVGLAGYIAMLLVLRAEMARRIHGEWAGWHVCETRVSDAMKARKIPAKPKEGFTGYIRPIESSAVDCRICKAKKGDPCIQPKR